MGYKGRFEQEKQAKAPAGKVTGKPVKKGKKKTGKKIALIVLLSVVVLLIAVVIGAVAIWNSLLDDMMVKDPDPAYTQPTMSQEEIDAMLAELGVNTEPSVDPTEGSTSPEDTWPKVAADKNISNIMLVGQAARDGEDYKLSDSMILVSINRERKQVVLTSFMRDLYVPIPAYAGHTAGRSRMNVCYHLGSHWTGSSKGGMEMLALCVEQNFGVPIDYTVEINFDAFEKVVKLLGGVDIELTQEEADYINKTLPHGWGTAVEGMNTLNRRQALTYARARSVSSGGGDFERTNRQRKVIISLIKKCTEKNLMELYGLVKEMIPYIVTDMDSGTINNFIFELLPMLKDLEIISQRIPFETEVLPNNFYSDMIDIYGDGQAQSVQVPNLNVIRPYLLETIGMTTETAE